MENWIETTVGKFCPFIYGKGLPEKDRVSSGEVPVFGSNGVVGKHSKPLVNEAGIIIGRKGTAGAVHFSPNPFWAIDTTFYVSDFPTRDLKFTFYLLKMLGLDKMNSDSAVPGLNRENAHSIRIKVPPIEEQKAIAKILSALDDKIELNRLMNQTLEQMARAVFKAWFVDFEPVRANLENRASASASPEIAELFPSEFENGLPKGWEVKKLNDVLEFAYGKALKEENRVVGNFPVYGSNGQVGWHNELLVEGAGIVVGRKGNPGTITWIDESFFPIDTTFYVKSKFDLKFLFYILQNLDLPNLSGDSAVPGLSRSIAYKESVVIPSNGLIETFGNIVTDIRKKCFTNRKESNNLSQIRDSVLPRLISGKIRVRQAEEML